MGKTCKSYEERAKELEEHKPIREKVFLDYMENESNSFKDKIGNHKNNSPHKQVQGSGFFSQDNVKQYQQEMVTHSFGKDAPKKKGRGSFFESTEECEEWIKDFFDLCSRTDILPTVSGLACWLKCSVHTILNHANNPNSPFCDICSQALAICHSSIEVGASESKLGSVPYIFQAKNYFGMKDEQQVTIGGTVNHELINSTDSLNALRSQINEEKQIEMQEAVWHEVGNESENSE
jgi:hypothetical protein